MYLGLAESRINHGQLVASPLRRKTEADAATNSPLLRRRSDRQRNVSGVQITRAGVERVDELEAPWKALQTHHAEVMPDAGGLVGWWRVSLSRRGRCGELSTSRC